MYNYTFQKSIIYIYYMKIVVRTVCFHFLCILIFASLYYNFRNQYHDDDKTNYEKIVDYILLSTTIQAGVGITKIFPVTPEGKLIMICQQIIMIMTHVFTIYIFTI